MVLGYHIILTGYGHWLPNDPRGGMSDRIYAPDLEKLGAIHFGRKKVQPSRDELREFYTQAQKQLFYPTLWWDDPQRAALAAAFGSVVQALELTCYACAVLSNHAHLLIRRHRVKCEQMANEFRSAGQESQIAGGFAPPGHPVFSADACHIYKSTVAEMRTCVEYIRANYGKHRLTAVPGEWVQEYDGWPHGPGWSENTRTANVKITAPNVNKKAPNVNTKAPNVNKKDPNATKSGDSRNVTGKSPVTPSSTENRKEPVRSQMERTPTPKGLRLHIGIFGRRNVGKSSLLNAMTRQDVSIVSEVAGTTTDPVEKPMELLPLGPVLFIDTAGIDDVGALGEMRVAKTRAVLDRTDVAILVADAAAWGPFEQGLLDELLARKTPTAVAFNKSDLASPDRALLARLAESKVATVSTVAPAGTGLLDLREALVRLAPDDFVNAPAIISDLVPPGELAVLVVPIDKEAPKGRLILPQVQSIRDLLDGDAFCLVVKERELREALSRLIRPPALVVTDSQAFLKVAADTPPEIPMTSFSILFARNKGDLCEHVRGATAIDRLKTGSRVLIAEACSHHPIGEDIGRVKIPRWLTQYVGGKLDITTVQGHDFPDTDEKLKAFDLVIHCGACMWNRREMLSRILRCRRAGVPITNYGLTIAYSLGIFERALSPFPAALEVYRQTRIKSTR